MNRETFVHLISIHKLDQEMGSHYNQIKSHKARLEALLQKENQAKDRINTAKTRLTELRPTLGAKESELYQTDKLIKKAHEHAKVISSENEAKAIERELQTLNPKKSSLEEEILSILGDVEICEQEITELNEFLVGMESTRIEIAKEVSDDVSKEEMVIAQLQKRIDDEWTFCPPSLKDNYYSVKKRRPFSELTYISGGNCHYCKIKIGREIEGQVERCLILEYCSGCGRILAPSLQ